MLAPSVSLVPRPFRARTSRASFILCLITLRQKGFLTMSTTFDQPQKPIHTPFRSAANGAISDERQADYLRTVCGYQLEPCAGIVDRDDAMRNATRCHALA
jgi:hypothetical protein